jgi:hypothetical protein
MNPTSPHPEDSYISATAWPPSYLHGHSALSCASSRHAGGRAGHGRATLNPDTVLPLYSGDRAIRSSEAVSSRRGASAGPVVGRRSARPGHAVASTDGHVALDADRLSVGGGDAGAPLIPEARPAWSTLLTASRSSLNKPARRAASGDEPNTQSPNSYPDHTVRISSGQRLTSRVGYCRRTGWSGVRGRSGPLSTRRSTGCTT